MMEHFTNEALLRDTTAEVIIIIKINLITMTVFWITGQMHQLVLDSQYYG